MFPFRAAHNGTHTERDNGKLKKSDIELLATLTSVNTTKRHNCVVSDFIYSCL